MARPAKNYCEYFSHDSGMRNHRKIKSLRVKFGISGYAIYCMLLEHLTGSEGNHFHNSDIEYELLSGDFGISATEIREVVDYCVSLLLLYRDNGTINSPGLDERLQPVYEKRQASKAISKSLPRVNGRFCNRNSASTEVTVTEIPQSKVKESKLNYKRESAGENDDSIEMARVARVLDQQDGATTIFTIEHCLTVAMKDERWMKANQATEADLQRFNSHLEKQALFHKNPAEYKKHFGNWRSKEAPETVPIKKKMVL